VRFLLACSPILLVFGLAFFGRRSALAIALPGLLYTSFLCVAVFETPVRVIILSAFDGVVTTLPLLLAVYAGMLLSSVLSDTGSLGRVMTWLSGRVRASGSQVGLLSIGAGNFLEGVGVIAEPVLAPMLKATGLSPSASATLSIQGYAGLMTLAFAGVIVRVLSLVTEIGMDALADPVAGISLVAAVLLAAAIPLVTGEGFMTRRGMGFVLLGFVSGAAAWGTARTVGMSLAAMCGGLAAMFAVWITSERGDRGERMPFRDLFPFCVLVAGLAVVNLFPTVRFLLDRISFTFAVVPTHPVVLRPLTDPYTYLWCALVLSLVLFPRTDGPWRPFLVAAAKRGWKPMASMAIFGAIGQLFSFSGHTPDFSSVDPGNNLATVLAQGTYGLTGRAYPAFAPLLGWAGTFLTGYGTASILLFGKFQVEAASLLGVSPALLASSLAVGAGVGSISTPFKIAIATVVCGASGREGEIMSKTVPIGICVSILVGLATLVAGLFP